MNRTACLRSRYSGKLSIVAVVGVALCYFLLTQQAFAVAGINRTINFQGKLVDDEGLNVADTSYTVVFTIYDRASGGTTLWSETQTVTTDDGVFRVALGSETAIPSSFNFNWDGLYLGMKVDADAEMTPRIRLTAVPYAFNAEKVSGLTVQDESGNASTSGTLRVANNRTITFGDAFTTTGGGITLTATGTTNASFAGTGSITLVDETNSQTLTNKTIGSTGLTFSGATTDITTVSNQDFTITPHGSGDVILSQDADTAVLIGTTANTPAVLSVSGGLGSNAAAIINQTNSGDILVASSSGVTRFVIANSGNVGLGTTAPQARLDVVGNMNVAGTATASALAIGYNGIGAGTNNAIIAGNVGIGTTDISTYDLSVVGTINASTGFYINGTQGHSGSNINCVNISGGIVTGTGSCAAGGGGSNWVLSTTNGTLSPINNTLDLLYGGTATTSAKFALLNMAAGTPTGSMSGNFVVMPHNGAGGNLGIGTTTPTSKLHIVGSDVSTSAGTNYGSRITFTDSGNVSSGTDASIGHVTSFTRSGASGGTIQAIGSWTNATTSGEMDLLIGDYTTVQAPANAGLVFGELTELNTNSDALAGGDIVGSAVYVTHRGTGVLDSMVGLEVSLDNTRGSVNTTTGIQNIAEVSLGNTNVLYAEYTRIDTEGTGTIFDAYGYHLRTPTAVAGSISNLYGVYVQNQTGAHATTAYNIYSQGSNSQNIIEGSLGIGTTAPAGKLAVNGTGNQEALVQVLGDGHQDLFTASASGATRIAIDKAGGFEQKIATGAARQASVVLNGVGATQMDAPAGIAVQGKYAYVAGNNSNSLAIFDLSVPSSPVEVGTIVDGAGATQLDSPKGIAVQGKYAYIASESDDSLSIIDISNPKTPIEVGTLVDDSNGGTAAELWGAHGVAVSGKYAYVASTADDSLTVVDISNPSNPKEMGVLKDGVNATALNCAWNVAVQGRYVYVVSCADSALSIIDVSDPSSPVEVGVIRDNGAGGTATRLSGAEGVAVSGKYAYVVGFEDALTVIDVSDPANPTEVATLVDNTANAANMGDSEGGIVVAGNYLYITTIGDQSLTIVDISTPTAPREVAALKHNAGATHISYPWGVAVYGNYAYVTNWFGPDSLTAVEITGIEAPSVTAGLVTAGTANITENAFVFNDLSVGGGINVGQGGILSAGAVGLAGADLTQSIASGSARQVNVLTINDTADLTGPKGIVVQGKYVYVVDNSSGSLLTFDLTVPATPTLVSSYISPNAQCLNDISVQGRYAYIADECSDAILIVDISRPEAPREVGLALDGVNATVLSGVNDVVVSGKYAYAVSYGEDTFAVIDVSDPTNPIQMGTLQDGVNATALSCPWNVAVQGRYAYVVTCTDDALSVIDIANPARPVEVGVIRDNSQGGTATQLNGAEGVFVSGKYAYVVSYGDSSLSIFDVSNPNSPTEVSTLTDDSVGGSAKNIRSPEGGIVVAGKYAYITSSGDSALAIIDVSDPENPREVDAVKHNAGATNLDYPFGVAVYGKYVYVTTWVDTPAFTTFELPGVDTPSITTGVLAASTANITEDAFIYNNLSVGSGLNVGSNGIFSAGGISLSSTTSAQLTVSGTTVGKALAIFNQTGNEDIFTASSSGTTRFVINNAGNVGIGTTAPGAILHLAGNDSSEELVVGDDVFNANDAVNRISLANSDGNASYRFGQSSTAYGFLQWNYNATEANAYASLGTLNSSNILVLNSNGARVGIGTSAPTAGLDISHLTGASTSGILTFRGTTDPSINFLNGENLTFRSSVGGDTGLNTRLIIEGNSGNVGIGTTTPVGKLNVNGFTTGKALVLLNETGNQDIFTASSSGTPRFSITNAGGIKLGTDEGSAGQCLVSGGTGAAADWGACGVDGFDINVFTTDGSWDQDTDVTGMEFAQVIVTGAGGGGGGADTSAGTGEGGGGGGGAGGTTIEMLTSAAVGSSTHTVTVGEGGTAGTDAGGTGGTGEGSSFGSLTTANGGVGGTGIVSTTTFEGTPGGAGGAATTDGDIETAGGDGDTGIGTNAGANGGTGGASYWGSGGRAGQLDGAGADAGSNGVAFGSGGGGAAVVDTATGAAGGTGAAGVVVVMSYTASGGDLAEWYDTRGGVEPGDVVAISDETLAYQSFSLGLQKSAVLEKAKPGSDIVGIVASIPYEVMGGDIVQHSKDAKPIALAGRVPVKVSEENGKIRAGDLLAVSSQSGIAMRSTKAGMTIGRALHDAACEDGEACRVMVLVNTTYSSGMLLKESLKEDGLDLAAIPGDIDVRRIILAKMIDEKKNILDNEAVSEINTDRVIAGLEVITPRVVTQELMVGTMRSSTASGQVTLELGKDGKFVGTDEAGNAVFTIDSDGNAYFKGTITAESVQVTGGAGITIDDARITSYESRITNIEDLLASRDSEVVSQENPIATAPVLGASDSAAIAFAKIDEVLASIKEGESSVDQRLLGADYVGDFARSQATVSGTLRVQGDGLIEGVLNVIESITTNNLIVSGLSQFFGEVVFKDNVAFENAPVFTQDTAGYITVKKGQKTAEITFTTPYATTPVISANVVAETMTDEQFGFLIASDLCDVRDRKACQEMLDERFFDTAMQFVIAGKSEKGFTIRLRAAAEQDYTFSWTAIAVKEVANDEKDAALDRKAEKLLQSFLMEEQ